MLAVTFKDLTSELEYVRRKANVCLDMHAALGVRWGDDPYAEIHRLQAESTTSHHRRAEIDALVEQRDHYIRMEQAARSLGRAYRDALNGLIRVIEDFHPWGEGRPELQSAPLHTNTATKEFKAAVERARATLAGWKCAEDLLAAKTAKM